MRWLPRAVKNQKILTGKQGILTIQKVVKSFHYFKFLGKLLSVAKILVFRVNMAAISYSG